MSNPIMKIVQFFYLFIFLTCLSLASNIMYAKSIRLDLANPASFSHKKDMQVTELKVTGVINKNTISAILNLYPNVEKIDLLNSKIVAFTDEKLVVYPANEIPSSAFNKKVKLKTVILPSGVTRIGKGAFWSCSGLENIVLPASIEVIDRFAFQLCVKLKSITFPEKLEFIGGATFASCHALTTINCLGKTPPRMTEWNPFTNIKSNACIVYVPKKSIANYQSSQFLNIFQIKAIK